MNKIMIVTLILFVGCDRPVDKPTIVVEDNFVLTDSLREVRTEFNKMDEADQDSIYKQIVGAELFVMKARNVHSTSEFSSIVGRVRSDFGWDVDRYPEFSSAVEKYLIEQGFDNPRQLDSEEDRLWLSNIFNGLSNAIKVKE